MKYSFNLLAPLSVSMVVITLGAAFGVLSGMGAVVGMVSACLITLVTALVGGSRYGVSSPTGPMTAAIGAILVLDQKWLAEHVVDLSLTELLSLTMIMAAAILFLLNLFKIHRLAKWVPQLVIAGFVNGVALLIMIAQFKSMNQLADWILMFATFLLALRLGFGAKKSKHMVQQLLSSSFLVIVIMSILTALFDWSVSFISLQPINLSGLFRWPRFDQINGELLLIVLPLAFELALIALLDTLLTAMILDRKSRTKTHLTRELMGQSLGMLAIGLVGGVPAAQSTVPSMMLWQEKGYHRLSKLALALFCIFFTFVFADLIGHVPLAVFGGVILKVAIDVADFTSIKALFCAEKKQKLMRMFVMGGTMLSTVFLSLNLAVILFTTAFVFWNTWSPKQWRIPDLRPLEESEGLIDEL